MPGPQIVYPSAMLEVNNEDRAFYGSLSQLEEALESPDGINLQGSSPFEKLFGQRTFVPK